MEETTIIIGEKAAGRHCLEDGCETCRCMDIAVAEKVAELRKEVEALPDEALIPGDGTPRQLIDRQAVLSLLNS